MGCGVRFAWSRAPLYVGDRGVRKETVGDTLASKNRVGFAHRARRLESTGVSPSGVVVVVVGGGAGAPLAWRLPPCGAP